MRGIIGLNDGPRSPDQITRELDTYELMQLLDYGGGDTFDSALLAAASQGADRRVRSSAECVIVLRNH